jgi:transposase-like protein
MDTHFQPLAREHGVNANQMFIWRRLYQQGRLGAPALMRDDGLLPVVLPADLPNNIAAFKALLLAQDDVAANAPPRAPR